MQKIITKCKYVIKHIKIFGKFIKNYMENSFFIKIYNIL